MQIYMSILIYFIIRTNKMLLCKQRWVSWYNWSSGRIKCDWANIDECPDITGHQDEEIATVQIWMSILICLVISMNRLQLCKYGRVSWYDWPRSVWTECYCANKDDCPYVVCHENEYNVSVKLEKIISINRMLLDECPDMVDHQYE